MQNLVEPGSIEGWKLHCLRCDHQWVKRSEEGAADLPEVQESKMERAAVCVQEEGQEGKNV